MRLHTATGKRILHTRHTKTCAASFSVIVPKFWPLRLRLCVIRRADRRKEKFPCACTSAQTDFLVMKRQGSTKKKNKVTGINSETISHIKREDRDWRQRGTRRKGISE